MDEAEKQSLRDSIVSAARSCIGTPWHHQARWPGVGIDCAGLLVYSFSAAGIDWVEETNYQRRADAGKFHQAIIDRGLVQISVDHIQVADMLVFRIQNLPQHAGIVSEVLPEVRYVHVPNIGKASCREDPLSPGWAAMIHSVWRLPQL